MINKCEYCNKRIPKSKGPKPRRFCNDACSQNWRYWNIPAVNKRMKAYSLKQGKRNRKSKSFRAKEKIYFDKWRKDNRLHFNEIMRTNYRKKHKLTKEQFRC